MSDGWHPDPFGRYAQRYHDGTSWTNHVSNVGGVTEQDPMGTQASPPGSMPFAPPVATMPSTSAPRKGNAFLRFLAFILDGILLSVLLWPFFGSAYEDMLFYETDASGEVVVDSLEWDFPVEVFVTQIAIGAIYQIGMIGRFGRTLGKMAIGVTVVREADGSPVGYGVAAVRYIAFLMYAIPLLGFILFIVSAVKGFSDSKGQTLHDNIASTMVAKSSTLTPR